MTVSYTYASKARTFLKLGRHPRLVRFLGQCTEDGTWLIYVHETTFVSLVTYVHLVMLRFRQIFHVDQPPAGEQLLVTEFAPMGSLVDALEELCDEDGDSLLTETHKVYL